MKVSHIEHLGVAVKSLDEAEVCPFFASLCVSSSAMTIVGIPGPPETTMAEASVILKSFLICFAFILFHPPIIMWV